MPSAVDRSMDPQIAEIVSLEGIRTRANKVLDAARAQDLTNFTFDETLMPQVEDLVTGLISRDYKSDKHDQIPCHSRLHHFSAGKRDRLQDLLDAWTQEGCESREIARRIIDLLFISVLLDAGAGDVWKYEEARTGLSFPRSEGIAVASILMFEDGKFQSRNATPYSVDGAALKKLDNAEMNEYFQISQDNMMTGFDNRVELLRRLGASLLDQPDFFGVYGRPGCLVDYLIDHSADPKVLDYSELWLILQKSLLPIWPENRTRVNGHCVGDAWPLQALKRRAIADGSNEPGFNIQPFHKLTQWLGYTLMTAFSRFLDVTWINHELGTGLAEYRHGGIFIDIPVLQLKPHVLEEGQRNSGQPIPQFDVTSDVVVEWRAMSIALLDELHERIKTKFATGKTPLSMSQMLEAGTFKAGRELAAKYRPGTKSSPILISGGDGTLF